MRVDDVKGCERVPGKYMRRPICPAILGGIDSTQVQCGTWVCGRVPAARLCAVDSRLVLHVHVCAFLHLTVLTVCRAYASLQC